MRPYQSDPFAVIAPFYDLDLEGFAADISFYRNLTALNPDVLELGCGTGRVATELAKFGRKIVGVELSPAMLAIAAERAEGLSVRLIEGDMCDLELDELFSTVLIPLGGLQHLESVDEVTSALTTVAKHLSPGGQAVIDIEAPHPDDWLPGPQPLIQHWIRPLPAAVTDYAGAMVTKLVAVEGCPSKSLKLVTYHFDVQTSEGLVQRFTQQFALRVVTPGELELAARIAGLRVTTWYGDYDCTPVHDGDERIIAVLKHASEGLP